MAKTAHRRTVVPRSFYNRDPVAVARDLIGCELIRGLSDGSTLAGRIVETEAYRQGDPASHSFSGLSDRNAAMFGSPGHAYVYFIYGLYDCFNVVCGPLGVADAVLIRAVEPFVGVSQMWTNRYGGTMPVDAGLPGVCGAAIPENPGVAVNSVAVSSVAVNSVALPEDPAALAENPGAAGTLSPSRKARNLTSGPGKVCLAFGIRRDVHNGVDLTHGAAHAGGLLVCHVTRPVGRIVATKRIGVTRAADRLWRFVEAGNPFLSRPLREDDYSSSETPSASMSRSRSSDEK